MHAFDIHDIADHHIIVRRANEGEKLTTLDGKEHTLSNEMLVIADGRRSVGIAGVMGGLNSEIKDTTKNIFFESAKFRRDSVRKTAKALGIRTEASARYEKGIDAAGCRFAMDRALSLIEELNAGDITSWAPDICRELPKDNTLEVPVQQIQALLGIQIPIPIMLDILNRLGISTQEENGILRCSIPSRRDDIEGAADLAEEIIRVYGYDHIESQPLCGRAYPRHKNQTAAALRACKGSPALLRRQ